MGKIRSNAELGELLYPGHPGAGVSEGEAAVPEAGKPLTEAEQAETLYPERAEQFSAQRDEDAGDGTKRTLDTIRTADGLKLHEGEYNGDLVSLASYNNTGLGSADLRGLNFGERSLPGSRMAGADLRGATFHGSLRDSNLKGARLEGADLSGCRFFGADLTGIEVDGSTDIGGADFTEAKVDAAKLMRCKNWRLARGLRPAR